MISSNKRFCTCCSNTVCEFECRVFSCQKHLKNQHTTEKPANSSDQEDHRSKTISCSSSWSWEKISVGTLSHFFKATILSRHLGYAVQFYSLTCKKHRWRFGDAAVTDIRCQVCTLLFSKIKLKVALNNLLKCILNPLTKRVECCLLTLSILKPQRNWNEKDLGNLLHQTNIHTHLYSTVFGKTW